MKKSFALLSLLLAHLSSFAQLGAMAVNPTRVHFDDQNRRQEIEFMNLSNDTLSFTISFSHYRMMEDGSLDLLEQPDTNLLIADQYLRIFPRKVTLAPREKQKVNLQFRRSSSMKAGEYRSHLTFSQFVDETKIREQFKTEDTTSLQTILLQMFKISVPAIIRTGETEAISSIENIQLQKHDSLQTVSFDITRSGNSSLYGDLEVEYHPPKGKSIIIGKQKYIGVYSEVDKRQMHVRLKHEQPLEDGQLTIRYLTPDKDNPVTLCEKRVHL